MSANPPTTPSNEPLYRHRWKSHEFAHHGSTEIQRPRGIGPNHTRPRTPATRSRRIESASRARSTVTPWLFSLHREDHLHRQGTGKSVARERKANSPEQLCARSEKVGSSACAWYRRRRSSFPLTDSSRTAASPSSSIMSHRSWGSSIGRCLSKARDLT